MSISNEQPPTTERDDPRWEFQLSWEQLLVATLERKVTSDDEPYDPSENENKEKDFPQRSFRTLSGEAVRAKGAIIRPLVVAAGAPVARSSTIEEATWDLTIVQPNTATNSAPTRYRFIIQKGDHDQYRVMHEASELPLGSEVVESLLGTVATMIPTGPTEYLTRE